MIFIKSFNFKISFLVMVAVIITLVSCDDNDPGLTVQGSLVNSNGLPVAGANVALIDGENIVGTAETDEEGAFELIEIDKGDYQLQITRSRYQDVTQSITVEEDLQDLKFTITGSATISGSIVNSQTGGDLNNAIVEFFEGNTVQEADTSSAVLRDTTDENGSYEFTQAPTGGYVCIISADDFIPRIVENIEVEEGDNSLDQSTVVEEVADGALRIVLTWGEDPSDLDTHFTGPVEDNSSERFHLYYVEQNPISSVSLDVDDTSSFGPETTTLTEQLDGLYRYSVHNFSEQSTAGAGEIESSPARVEVFDSSGLVESFTPPQATATSGNVWRVFEMNVSNGQFTITESGEYDQVEDEDDASQFKIPSGSKSKLFSVEDF